MSDVISPARAAGLPVSFSNSRTCWSKRDLPRCGWRMFCKCDPRHVGEVCALLPGPLPIRIRWQNGWKSDHRISELERC